jgi:hypothetical protein
MISEVRNSNPFFKLRGIEKDQEFSLIINIDTIVAYDFTSHILTICVPISLCIGIEFRFFFN